MIAQASLPQCTAFCCCKLLEIRDSHILLAIPWPLEAMIWNQVIYELVMRNWLIGRLTYIGYNVIIITQQKVSREDSKCQRGGCYSALNYMTAFNIIFSFSTSHCTSFPMSMQFPTLLKVPKGIQLSKFVKTSCASIRSPFWPLHCILYVYVYQRKRQFIFVDRAIILDYRYLASNYL